MGACSRSNLKSGLLTMGTSWGYAPSALPMCLLKIPVFIGLSSRYHNCDFGEMKEGLEMADDISANIYQNHYDQTQTHLVASVSCRMQAGPSLQVVGGGNLPDLVIV
jgi:hypothetical protein